MNNFLVKSLRNIETLFKEQDDYTLLVGAGISMDDPSNLPHAREIIQVFIERFAPEEEVEYLLNLKDLRYEMIVERLVEFIDKDLLFLDYFDLVISPNINHLFMAASIINGFNVITTNFDYLIEYALIQLLGEDLKKKILPIITKADFENYADPLELLESDFFPMYKIHGSKKNIIKGHLTSESLITTMNSYGKNREPGQTFALEPYKIPTVQNLMNNKTLVVMGYSGRDDFDIGPILKTLKNISSIIWIDHANTSDHDIFEFHDINQEEISNIKNRSVRLLAEIKLLNNIKIYYIRTSTSKFVEEVLWNQLIKEITIKKPVSLNKRKIPTFKAWIEDKFPKVADLNKYMFAGNLYYDIGDIDALMRISKRGLRRSEKSKDQELEAFSYMNLGVSYYYKSDYRNALKNYEKSLELYKIFEKAQEISYNLNNIAVIYGILNDYEKELNFLLESIEIAKKIKDLHHEGTCLGSIGNNYQSRGNYEKALEYYSKAVRIDEQSGNLQNKAVHLLQIGLMLENKNELQSSMKNYQEALNISEELGDSKKIISVLTCMGRIYIALGSLNDAEIVYNKALSYSTIDQNLVEKANLLDNIGVLYKFRGETDKALRLMKEAYDLDDKIGDMFGKAVRLNSIGLVHAYIGNKEEASNAYEKSLKIFESLEEKGYSSVVKKNLESLLKVN